MTTKKENASVGNKPIDIVTCAVRAKVCSFISVRLWHKRKDELVFRSAGSHRSYDFTPRLFIEMILLKTE